KLYLSSSSSTMIFDDDEIPAVKALRNANRKNDVRNFLSIMLLVMIENVRTKKGWNFPSYGGDNCKKSTTRKLRRFWCKSCNKPVEFPVLRYRLELDFADDTAHVVVVMNDELTTSLVGCSAESIMEEEDEELRKACALARWMQLLAPKVHIEDSDSEDIGDSVRDALKEKNVEIEDSEAEVSCGSAHDGRKKKGGSHSDKKKRERYLSDEE
ncbi:nucleic acid-binding, OB-fold protein, partial [Tanacetum coccineum]